ncbi:MAG TPA: hypothetical protein VLT33_25315, partial [Labilithrix sp.]|nr:hypothetical protein [Labilithrix sp.]
EREEEAASERRGRGGWAVIALGVVLLGAAAYLAFRPAPVEVTTLPTPAASVTADASGEVVADASGGVVAAAEIADATASYVAVDAGLPSVDAAAGPAIGGERGVLLMPASADSHRVYVDGRLAGVPPPPIVVGCGRHVVKIGSQGREQNVVVPCGGSVSLAYP